MIQRFTEMYYDDAVRFAQYIQATEGGEIELVKEDADGFRPNHELPARQILHRRDQEQPQRIRENL